MDWDTAGDRTVWYVDSKGNVYMPKVDRTPMWKLALDKILDQPSG